MTTTEPPTTTDPQAPLTSSSQGSCPLILPSHPSFRSATWSRVANHRRDPFHDSLEARTPYAIAKPRTTAHVVEAVQLARKEKARVAVRSGGHSWAAWSVRRGAVLLDLEDLHRGGGERGKKGSGGEGVEVGGEEAVRDGKGEAGRGGKEGEEVGEGHGKGEVEDGRMEYDPETHIVRCSPAVTSEELVMFLKPRGRFFGGGHCPDVGMGGFLLQGGMGWCCRGWGWACEQVVGIDVVTAAAEEIHCSETENEDLFWASRGAGPGFPAVVTRLLLKTKPLMEVFKNTYIYPLKDFRRVLEWVVEVSPTCDLDTEIVTISFTPPGLGSPHILAAFTSLKPTLATAQQALAPIHSSRPEGPIVDIFCEATTLESEFRNQRAAGPDGHRYCAEDAFIKNGSGADVASLLESAFMSVPNEKSFVLYFAMAPGSGRYDPTATKPIRTAVSSAAGGGDGGGAVADSASLAGVTESPPRKMKPTTSSPPSAAAPPTAPPSTTSPTLPPWPSMALSMQSDHYLALYACWDDATQDEQYKSWVWDAMKVVERDSVGSYLGDADFRYRRAKFWGKEQAGRLKEIRKRWDPMGVVCGFLEERDGEDEGGKGEGEDKGRRRNGGRVIENALEWVGQGGE